MTDAANGARYTGAEVSEIVARRAVVEQVKGMLMFAFGVDADEAFTMLRDQARSNGVKLSAIADAIRADHRLVTCLRGLRVGDEGVGTTGATLRSL